LYGFVIPTLGWNLLTKLIAGEQLRLSRIMFGSGRFPENENPLVLTDLIQPVAAGTSTIPTTEGKVASFIAEYRSDLNGGLEHGFWINEFGVFAIDPDIGEILLYYGSLGDFPQYVAPYAGGSIDVRRFPVSIILSDDIEVVVDYPPIAFMTAQDVDDYFRNTAYHMLLIMLQNFVAIHNVDPDAHPDIRALLKEVLGRIGRLEDMLLNDVTGNPFLITFDTLNDVIVSGVWNVPMQRIEF